MSVAQSQGLTRVSELYRDRGQRARELQSQGSKIIGYMGSYPVLEMLTALDLVPYAVLGDMTEPVTAADAYLSSVVCPVLRSVLDLGLKGKYSFLDGMVNAHICEVGEKLAHMWRIYLEPGYAHFIDTPHTTHGSAVKQHRSLLEEFRKTLEAYTGQRLTDTRIKKAITLHNEQRALVRELYRMTKSDPPLVSGSELVQVCVALSGLPVQEGSQLLREVIADIRQRPSSIKSGRRIMLWGSVIDNSALVELIESAGANVVFDDTDLTTRMYFADVRDAPDPLDALASRYLLDIKSPRTFFQAPPDGPRKDFMADLEWRFGYLRDFAREWNASGVVLEVIRYCDIHAYEVPVLRDYLEKEGIPSMYIEHDYSATSLAQLRTRIQGFLEIVG